MQNRSAVLRSARHLGVLDRPVPTPAAHHVLVEVRAVGICGSDVHYYERGRIGPYLVDQPMTIGHRAVGTIDATGEAVHHRRVGGRVALEPGVPCRSCGQCLSGCYNLCPDVVFFATPLVDGAISQRDGSCSQGRSFSWAWAPTPSRSTYHSFRVARSP